MPQITRNGIVVDRQADITTRVTDEWRTSFGQDFDVSTDSDARRLADPVLTALADLNELALQIVAQTDEAQAQGVFLDSIGRLTGASRDAGARSVGTITITGDAGTVIPEGYLIASSATEVRFRTTARAILPDTGAPVGTETVDAAVESVDLGAFVATAGTLTAPINVVGGVASVTNAAAVTPGSARQTDPQFRSARRLAQQPSGRGTVGGIFLDVSAVENVQVVRVIANPTDAIDANGVPARSIRVVVFPTLTGDADRRAVATALANNQTGSTNWDGSEVFVAQTQAGVPITVRYSFATPVNLGVSAALTTNAAFPSNGVDLVRTQISKWFGLATIGAEEEFSRLGPGDDVILQRILCNVLETVPGIDFIDMLVGPQGGPITTPDVFSIGASQVAAIADATSDITVTT